VAGSVVSDLANAAQSLLSGSNGNGAVHTVSGRNLGTGHPVFAGAIGTTDISLSFKSISAGNGVTITEDQNTIVLSFNSDSRKISFLNLFEAPSSISFGLMYGTNDGKIGFSSAPTQQGTVLTFDGMNFVWRAPGAGTVSSVGLTGDNAIRVTGSTITSAGSFALNLTNTGVAAGTYSAATITVDAQGRVVSAASTPVGEANVGANLGTGTQIYAGKSSVALNFKSIATSGPLSIADNGTTITLSSNAVTSVAINAQDGLYAIGGPITGNGTFRIGLALSSVTPGTYNSVTVDNYGRVTSGTLVTQDSIANVGPGQGLFIAKVNGQNQFKSLLSDGIIQVSPSANAITISANAVTQVGFTAGQGIALSGNTTILSTGSVGIALSNTGVTPGNYSAATITVDAQGRITSAASTPLLAPTGVAAGSYSAASITVDTYGRIIAASNTSSVAATNIGTGAQVYAGQTNGNFQFRSLAAGNNVTITPAGDSLTISATVPAQTPMLTISDSKGNIYSNVSAVALASTLNATQAGGVITLSANVSTTGSQGLNTISDGTNTVVQATSLALGGGLTVKDLGNGAAQIVAPAITQKANATVTAAGVTATNPEILSFVGATLVQNGTTAVVTIPAAPTPSISIGDTNANVTYPATTKLRFSGFTTGQSNTGEVTVSAPLTSSNLIVADGSGGLFTNPSKITFANGTFTQVNGALTLTANPPDLSNYVTLNSDQTIIGSKTFANTVTAGYDLNVTRNLTAQGLAYFGAKLTAAAGMTVSGAAVFNSNITVQSTGSTPITALVASGTGAHTGYLNFDQTSGTWSSQIEGGVKSGFSGFLIGNVTGNVTGNADTATFLSNAYSITLGGSLVGSLSYGQGNTSGYVTLTNTGVSAGTYSSPTVTVGSDGRITSIQNGVGGGGANGTVTAQNTGIGQQILKVNGTDLTFKTLLAGNAITISNTGNELKFDLNTSGLGTVTQVAINGNNGIVASGSPITTSGTYTVALTNTTVTPGTYSYPTITVDATGRITSAAAGSAAPVDTASNLGQGDAHVFAQKNGQDFQFRSLVAGSGIILSETGQTITVTANVAVPPPGLTSIPVTDGATTTYATGFQFQGATVTAVGNTAVVAVPQGTVKSISATSDGNIQVSGGPITSTGTLNFSLSNTGVIANTYAFATVTVDANGRVTAAAPGSAVSSVTVSSTSGEIAVANATVTSTGTIDLSLANSGVTAGTYAAANVTVDRKGRVTSIQAAVQKQSDVVTVTDQTAGNSYSFSYKGSILILNTNCLTVYVNRKLLRPSEFTVQGNSIVFNIDLYVNDELEVITLG
jgi:hypothetical protein